MLRVRVHGARVVEIRGLAFFLETIDLPGVALDHFRFASSAVGGGDGDSFVRAPCADLFQSSGKLNYQEDG